MSKRNSVRAGIGDVSTVKAKSRAGRSSSKRLLGGVVIAAVVALLSASLIYIVLNSNSGIVSGRIIASSEFSNFAWDYVYHGTAITDKGNICRFDFGDDKLYKAKDLDGSLGSLSGYLMSESECSGKVSSEDLARIKELVGQIKDLDLEDNSMGVITADAGTSCTYAWNYKANEKRRLNCSGDLAGINPDEHTEELVKLINKYTQKKS